MISSLTRWLSRDSASIAPEEPFRVVGDVHGRVDLLSRVLTRPGPLLVCVGDYVDRGPDSAGVLRSLAARTDVTCLMGNHEEMMLAFLDDPVRHSARWLRHGGVQTLASFGLTAPQDPYACDVLADLAGDLHAAIGEDLIDWLRHLPSSWRSGNVAVVHAAADPALSLDAQASETLRWGHPSFPKIPRRDGVWVVHGHVVVSEPRLRGRVVSIDTGAWATDRLTVAHVSPGELRFETA